MLVYISEEKVRWLLGTFERVVARPCHAHGAVVIAPDGNTANGTTRQASGGSRPSPAQRTTSASAYVADTHDGNRPRDTAPTARLSRALSHPAVSAPRRRWVRPPAAYRRYAMLQWINIVRILLLPRPLALHLEEICNFIQHVTGQNDLKPHHTIPTNLTQTTSHQLGTKASLKHPMTKQ
jgi:hypothetical protein